MSRQNYYKARNKRKKDRVYEGAIKSLVLTERMLQPRLGGRKVLKILTPELRKRGIKMGRDRFFDVLRRNGLLVEKLPRSMLTTNSYHTLPIFLNKVKGKELTGPNQAWASDITYIRKSNDFMYLSLITDMYSRKIVGHHLDESLDTAGPLKALKMALGNKPKHARPIHHSDRGSQYCSHQYINELTDNGLVPSMTERDHCAENALAERVNGILKQEYGLRGRFNAASHIRQAVCEAVWLYNTKRPHFSLGLKIPDQVHLSDGSMKERAPLLEEGSALQQ